jgi:hypothetical protein
MLFGEGGAVMTEPEWLTCDDPDPMLEGFPGGRAAHASERKLRLFACAWVRRVWHVFDDERCRRAVEVAERFAEGMATDEELGAARNDADAAAFFVNAEGICDGKRGAFAALQVTSPAGYADVVAIMTVSAHDSCYDVRVGAMYCDPEMADYLRGWESWESVTQGALGDLLVVDPDSEQPILLDPKGWKAARREQADLVREVFGNPFRPVAVDPVWLTPIVTALAEAAYQQQQLPQGTLDVLRLAVLADALEEAGCTDAGLLNHLRDWRPHVRGCWAVDLVLARK